MAKKNRQLALHGFGAADAGPSQPTATTGGRQPAAPAGHDRRQVPPANLKGKSVYVIDAHSLIFQVFHAIGEMTSPDGEPVTAIYGFARDLLYLIEEKKPDFLLCAFDLPGSTFRHEIYQPYKADRGEMPDDLRVQFPVIREMLELLGVPVLQYENHEADDVLASVARICDQAGAQCFVVTGDKDCRQLITDNVKIYNIRKDQVFDRAALEKEWGIRPEQVVDFQALVGDATDNVPGVPLIGPKLAQQLLEKYGTLDEVLDHADEVSGAKRQENLRQGREIALLSRQLVRLVDDLPMTVDWSTARPSLDHAESAVALFRRLGFRGLTDRLVALAGLQMRDEWVADYQCVGGEEDLRRLAQQLSQQSQISVDVETTSVLPRFAELVGCSVAWEPGKAWYLPVRAPAGEKCLDTQEVLNALRPVLENPAIQKIGQNLKYDMIVLRAAGIRLAGVAFDSMLASYLIEAGQRNHNLDALALRYLQHETTKISELIGGGKQQKQMDQVPLDQITPYAAEDVDVPLRLRPILEERLIELGLDQLNRELEVPLISVLADMEYAGIKLDIEHLSRLSVQYQQQLDALEAEIYDLAGHPFNIASPKQLATVLFTEQGLPVLKKTKTGPSTDGEVLEQLAANHPLPAKIIEYRQFAKLKNTYVDALPALVHPQTGRIHATFHQVVTATGRLSSSDPNLQNIPVRAERGREIRAAFLPGPPDWQLLAADYSQIELRVLAHYSKDEALCEAFARDEDVHKMVASQVYGVPPSKVTVEMRRGAKAVNFGVIYGQTAFGLAKSLGIEVDEAAEFIDAYFAKYPRVEEFLRQVLADCRQAGYVTTILGRRRNISGVREEVIGRQLNFAERTAINTIIQGSAADMIKQAMVNIHRRLEKENRKSQMLLQIHDELVFEVPPQELDAMQQLVPAEMGSAVALDVPLEVDVKIGANWAAVE